MKYTFTIEGNGKIILESRAGESNRHIALKILAYLLFRNETGGLPLRIEQSVGQRHKPDLVVIDPETGQVILWIDCGQIEVKRLGRIAAANPEARVIVVKPTGGETALYARAAARFLPPAAKRAAAAVTYLGFDEDFLPAFLHHLRGTNNIAVSRDNGSAQVSLNEERLVTNLHILESIRL